MGHLVGKDLYRQLGSKIDALTLRAPYNETLHEILTALYSEEEADLVLRMPYGLSTLGRLQRTTGLEPRHLERVLESLCHKGLVMDVLVGGKLRYLPSPMAIGIFEFTMMRTDAGVDSARMAKLFKDYLGSGATWRANLADGQQLQLMRTLPHEGTLFPDEHVEVLDYDKASAIVDGHSQHAIGICSCRHEKHHTGDKACDHPLGKCMSMGTGAEFLIRRGFARSVTKQEMLEELADSREKGLVFNADNVQRGVGYICNCCGCCCNVLLGISKHGFAHTVVTSSYLARSDDASCDGCGHCKKACPIHAIRLERLATPVDKKRFTPVVDEELCIGCGVCAQRCPTGSMRLHARPQRVIPPATTFERVILQCLEAGTLQNQLFDDPTRVTHQFLRGFVGAVLRLPPVKQALLSDSLRSRFLDALKGGAARTGNKAALEF
ncbi:MAG: 4Fe-4S dicluster domain-containing protein [Pseudomonadota bacterium]